METLKQVYTLIAGSGPLGIGLILFGLFLIWIKWRFVDWAARKSMVSAEDGWQEDARTAKEKRTVGFSSSQTRVLTFPKKLLWIGILATVFFGLCGYVTWPASWAAFTQESFKGMIAVIAAPLLVAMGLFVILISFRKIAFNTESLTVRHPLIRKRFIFFSQIKDVEFLHSQTPSSGLRLILKEGRPVKIPGAMIGIRDLAKALAPMHKKAAIAAAMVKSKP